MAEQKKSAIMVLMLYFGKKGDQKLADFKVECDTLSEKDRLELARLAAKELGLQEEALAFKLADD